MASVALIAMAAIPAAYTAVGIVLIVLALTCAALFVWKLREANTLRKEVMELRDTMRMMRYEEANLARMLHTADKNMPATEEITEEVAETAAEEAAETAAEEPQETAEATEPTEDTETIGAIDAAKVIEAAEAIDPVEESDTEEVTGEPTAATIKEPAEETAVESAVEPVAEPIATEAAEEPVAEESIVEEPTVEVAPMPIARSRKQTIRERCPAIPNDLFAAWFEENDNESSTAEPDEIPAVTPAEENIAEQSAAMPTQEATEETAPLESPKGSESPTATASLLPQAEEALPMNREDERFCRKLERTIQTRMRNPNLNVDIIAAQFGLGRTNFYRKVRELTGMSPNDYLRKCRMTKAAELLQNTGLSISDICAQVGIPDAQYFSRVFKAHFGVSPSIYREQ